MKGCEGASMYASCEARAGTSDSLDSIPDPLNLGQFPLHNGLINTGFWQGPVRSPLAQGHLLLKRSWLVGVPTIGPRGLVIPAGGRGWATRARARGPPIPVIKWFA